MTYEEVNLKVNAMQEIGPHHFSHAKAVKQGVDWRKSAIHYFGFCDEKIHNAVMDVVLRMLKARGIKIKSTEDEVKSKKTETRPSLEEFIESKGMDGFSEEECLLAYEQEFGSGDEQSKSTRASLKVDAKYIDVAGMKIEIEAASKMEGWFLVDYERPATNPGLDELGKWFGAKESRALKMVGAQTVVDVLAITTSKAGFEMIEFLVGETDAIGAMYKSKLLTWSGTEINEVAHQFPYGRLAKEWVNGLGIQKNTKHLRKQACVRWALWCSISGNDPLSSTHQSCLGFLRWTKACNETFDQWKNYSASTTDLYGRVLNGFFAWLKDSGHSDENAWNGSLCKLRSEARQGQFNAAECSETSDERRARSQAVIALMNETGLKLKPLTLLKYRDLVSVSEESSMMIFKGGSYVLGNGATKAIERYTSLKFTALPCPDAPVFSRVREAMVAATYESIREGVLACRDPNGVTTS